MSRHQVQRAFTVTGIVLVVALSAVGCGRRGQADVAAGSGGSTTDTTSVQSPAVTAEPSEAPATTSPSPSASPATTPPSTSAPTPAPTPQPTAAPMQTPDLSAIQQLLDDLDAALGADATADTDEGSAP